MMDKESEQVSVSDDAHFHVNFNPETETKQNKKTDATEAENHTGQILRASLQCLLQTGMFELEIQEFKPARSVVKSS